MRQIAPSTNLVLAVLAGLGVLASLTLPWYAAPVDDPTTTDGPIERGAFQVGQVFATSAKGTVSGSDAIGGGSMVLVAAVAIIGLLGLMISANAARRPAEDMLRLFAFGPLVAVIALAVMHPGTEASIRMHYGMLVALAAAALTANAAYHGASWREKKPAPVRPRYGSAR